MKGSITTKERCATEAVNRVGMDTVQEFLGHTRRTMTKKYARVNMDRLRAVLPGKKT